MESGERCGSCGSAIPARSRICMQCGWENQSASRKCLKCEGPVTLTDIMSRAGIFGGAGGVGGFLFWYLLGPALAGAIVCFATAVFMFGGLFSMSYECSFCSKAVPLSALSKGEKGAMAKRKVRYVISSVVFLVLSIGLAALWFWAIRQQSRL